MVYILPYRCIYDLAVQTLGMRLECQIQSYYDTLHLLHLNLAWSDDGSYTTNLKCSYNIYVSNIPNILT